MLFQAMKDTYNGLVTCVKTHRGVTRAFPYSNSLHQGSALCPYLFTLVIDEFIRHIQDAILWCMLFQIT